MSTIVLFFEGSSYTQDQHCVILTQNIETHPLPLRSLDILRLLPGMLLVLRGYEIVGIVIDKIELGGYKLE